MQLDTPNSSRFFSSAFARDALMSLASSNPSPFSLAASSVAFPPGAAQRSRTLSPGFTGSMEAGIIALGSCI